LQGKNNILTAAFAFAAVFSLFGLSQLAAGAIVYFVPGEVSRKWLLSISIEGIYLSAAVFLCFFSKTRPGLRKAGSFFALLTVISAAGFVAVSDFLSDIFFYLASEKNRVLLYDYFLRPVAQFLTAGGEKNIAANLFLGAAVPALCEEFFFRGALQPYLQKSIKPSAAIALSALLFALVHLNPLIFVPLFLLGMLCGYVYLKTENILYPIMIHFINNALVIAVFHATGRLSFPFSLRRAFLIIIGMLLLLIYIRRLGGIPSAGREHA
jgi:membrane protease YdiL (CAAX protease family)